MWAIVLVAIVSTGSALAFSLVQTPTYEASVKMIMVGQDAGDRNLESDVSGLQALTLTVAKAAPTKPVADAVVKRLDLPEGSAEGVLRNISAEPNPGTIFVNISYRHSKPEEAQRIPNTIGQLLSERISEEGLGSHV